MQKSILGFMTLAVCLLARPAQSALILVENGESRMPIVIFADAPPLTRQAADELAYYIEQTSGVRPEVLEGQPDPLPESAIWVGVQPILAELFPDQDFDFQHPEEILIAANAKHLVIAGRDVWDPAHLTVTFSRGAIEGVQQEYGTHNAVYTFLHDYLGVRWLWPGELGEDVLKQKTIAFEPFMHRYHPQIRSRYRLLRWSALSWGGPGGPDQPAVGGAGAKSHFWARAQRLQLDSLGPFANTGFGAWWNRFHETHPEYFALQPDGTRSLCTSASNVKICVSNPKVWTQWLADAEAWIERNPNTRVFYASPGDSHYHGHCVCESCLAWDHPEGEARRLNWQGLAQVHVSLSERYVIFANHLARLLKARFPGMELYVYTYAYGVSLPPPVEAVAADNVIIGPVANFLLRSDFVGRDSPAGRTHREHFAGWKDFTRMNFWRPNTGSPVGFQWGLPDVPLRRTIDDLKFAAAHGMMGIEVDFMREHWATQAPLYYLMAQLVWNPDQDGESILKDYYRRAFGPASAEMEAYWTYMEAIREDCYGTEKPGESDHDIIEYYDAERLAQAAALLDAAKAALGVGDDRYRKRIEFVGVGLEFTRLITECGRLMRRVENHEDPDGAARAQAIANWAKIRALRQAYPGAMRWNQIFRGPRGDGPPVRFDPGEPEAASASANTARLPDAVAPETAVVTSPAAATDWELVFSDSFDRDELGENWNVVNGEWRVADGWLRGSGTLISERGFPGGFQRLEFEAMTDVAPVMLFDGRSPEVTVGDMSSFIHAQPPADGHPLRSGYFFQFGGFNNTQTRIRKAWHQLAQTETVTIAPEKLHRIVVENDAGTLRLFVDGELALEHRERDPSLLGEGHDQVGFYFWTACKVQDVKVYLKRTVDRDEDLKREYR